jgi:hypothetical protein
MQELMGWRKHDKVTVAVEQARGFRKLVRIGFYVFQNVDVKNRVETAILWNARDRSSNDLRRRTRRSLRSAHRYSSGETAASFLRTGTGRPGGTRSRMRRQRNEPVKDQV